MRNPFEIKTPEQNTAQEVVDLFVDVFSEFSQVLEPGHTFIHGPRGSGKSMMFRYMQPDCQRIVKDNCKASELDYFAVYVGVKQTNINNTDLERLDKHAAIIFNEHLLSAFTMANVFESLKKVFADELDDVKDELVRYYRDQFCYYAMMSGYRTDENTDVGSLTGFGIVDLMVKTLACMENECFQYCSRITLSKDLNLPYRGSLTNYNFFVKPLILELKKISLFPQGKPFFLLIDDAGYLNVHQTKVLNSWVSYRSTQDICLKISTQYDYRTHITTNNKRIDAPHDYSEINIASRYTSSDGAYFDRVKAIVHKRLELYLGIDMDPEEFFPANTKQENAINIIKEEIRKTYSSTSKSYDASGDAARRYARPEYIKRLQRDHKSGYYYSYSGFHQLVDVSSGIIRHFLAPAQQMFSTVVSKYPGEDVRCIPFSIQDEIIRTYSDRFLHNEFDDIRKDQGIDDAKSDLSRKLYNLVNSLGQLFHTILVSDAAERRVFSVALTDNPDEELYEVLDLCEQFGYLQKGSIGNKAGTGRNRLYVLSRVLAPYFKLDPTSFAGYKFMKSEILKIALTDKDRFLRIFEKNSGKYVEGELFNNDTTYE